MAMPNPERVPLDKMLRLVEQLSLIEREELRRQLNNKSWADRWDALTKKVDEQSKGSPPLTDDEIAEEVMAYRTEQKAKRDQSSN